MPATDHDWTKPAALAIPKEGYFELERGRYGPVFPRTPACYGFSIIAKVKEGREDAIREHGKTIQAAITETPEFLAPLRLHYLRWVLFDVGDGLTFQYQGIFETDFDKYTEDAAQLFGQSGINTVFTNLEGFPEDWKENPDSFVKFFDDVDLSSLRKGYYGASPMPTEILAEMRERLPNLRLWNFYGQTEMAPLASALGPDEQDAHAGAAGRPVLNVETTILDEGDSPVPQGTVGEIAHRSPHLMLGYLDHPAKTAEAFRGGWFHFGDLGYYDEYGLLHVVDRKKDMIKTGGEYVASREVEEVLYQHNGIQEVAVFGLSHPVWVEAVVAAVVLRDGATLSEDDVLAHCREHLAGFKTPKQVFFVDSLPKNPSGKLLKRDLRERFSLETSIH